jgi:hypothetical protein
LPMKMEQAQCSETSAIKHHTPENNPKVTHDKIAFVLAHILLNCVKTEFYEHFKPWIS